MEKDNRVLSRRGARALTEQEASKVQGGLGTLTVCTVPNVANLSPDGDSGECGNP